MAKRILCVIRVSTLHQEMESQHNDMIGFLVGKGYKEEEIEWLEAKGASARSVNKAYLQMLDDIKSIILSSPTIKACAVWHLNRLGRVESYIIKMKEWFIENHIQLFVKTPDMTLLNPDGSYNQSSNIVFSMFSAFIPADTEELMEKVRRGREEKRRQGKWTGTPLHYGFKPNKDKYVVVDEEKMQVVKLIFDEYSTGTYSINTLYKELKSRGNNLTERLIQSILTLDIYKEYVGEDLWNKCKEVREGKNMFTKESKNCYLALKVLKCPYCGSNCVSNSGHYVCYRKKAAYRFPENERCLKSPNPSTEVIDTILWDVASTIHRGYLLKVDTDNIAELNKRKEVLVQKYHQLNVDLEKTTVKRDRAKELYMDGDISKAEYERKKVDANQEASRIKAEIGRLSYEINQITDSIEQLKHPNITTQFELMASVGDITKADEMRSIIQKHIKTAYISFTEYNGKKCFLLKVIDKHDEVQEFIYDYNKKKCDIFSKLYRVKKDGIVPYSLTHQPISKMLQKNLDGAVNVLKDSDAMQRYLTSIAPSLTIYANQILKIDGKLSKEDEERLERLKNDPNNLKYEEVAMYLKMIHDMQNK